MGRSPGDPGRVDDSAAARAWEAIRRALGRLVAHTAVAQVPAENLALPVATGGDDVLRPTAPRPGGWEAAWRPTAAVAPGGTLVPARPGGGGADLAAVTLVVSADAALHPPSRGVFPAAVGPIPCVVHAGPADVPALPPVHTAPVSPTGGVVRALAAAPPRAVPVAAPAGWGLTRSARVLVLARGQRGGLPPPPSARVRTAGVALLARIPLRRSRLPVPRGAPASRAFADERRRLAAAAQLSPDDVVLVGVFPNVPASAIHKLAVEEDGDALLLWLKPEVFLPRRPPPRMVTLILGRQHATGRLLQAIG